MELRAWKVYGAAMTLIVGAFFLSPESGSIPIVWSVAVGWSGAAAVLVGIRLHRPPAAAAWYLFAVGVFLNSSGIGVEGFLTRNGRSLDPPSVVDAFYLSLYPTWSPV